MKPKKPLRVAMVIITLIIACTPQSQPVGENAVDFIGTWTLTEYIPHSDGSAEWTSYGDSIIYQKHLTKDHFTWFKYDQKNNTLLGMGGGSYKIEDGQYIEDIKFFYPPGSSELGQAIPFNFEFPQNKWHHTGYAKVMEMDPESGEIVVVDSNKIEEKWVKTELSASKQNSIVGTWDLISYREQEDGNYIEYPEFVGYIKLITPTHFTWIYFNKEDDEIYAAGSGRYTYQEDTYSETINMIYPTNTGQLGETINFSARLENNKWKHKGQLPVVSIDTTNGNIIRDSALIDEVWKPHSE